MNVTLIIYLQDYSIWNNFDMIFQRRDFLTKYKFKKVPNTLNTFHINDIQIKYIYIFLDIFHLSFVRYLIKSWQKNQYYALGNMGDSSVD